MNVNRFITRINSYAVKLLSNGAARIYIKNNEALRAANFFADKTIRIERKKGRIDIHLDPNGTRRVYGTSRGELLELKDKETAAAVGHASRVSVTFRKNKITITVHREDAARMRREARFVSKLLKGEPLRKGSFFSGLGMLAFSLKEGLSKQGFKTEIAFANDNNELAMACNLEGNPIWQDAAQDAVAVVDDLSTLDLSVIPNDIDMVEIGYPCVGFSSLAKMDNLDLNHSHCGTLFIPLLNALRKMNPAMVLFENVPRFGKSETLTLIEKAMPGYRFIQTLFNGHDFGELEARPRVCVVAVSQGLPDFDFEMLSVPPKQKPEPLSAHLNDIPSDSPAWKTMEHVKARDDMKHLGYRNCLYTGAESEMVTIPASYGSVKAGTPMVQHPSKPDLQRQIMPDEHASIRALPDSLKALVIDVWNGNHPLVSKRGNFSAAHRLLGNGVSRRIWVHVGALLGAYLRKIIGQHVSGSTQQIPLPI